MTESAESPEEEAADAPEPLTPAAIPIALGQRPAPGSLVDSEAAGFLKEQRRLIHLQTEHLHEQRELVLAHLRVRRWKDRISLSLQALAFIVGFAAAIGLAHMAWEAHEDHGPVGRRLLGAS
jgi:hypothetical protein